MFKKIAIVGTGLIGGSLALNIKKKRIALEVVGVSRHKSSLAKARSLGAIDKGSQGLGIIKGADLIILATPVNQILNLAEKISRIAGDDAIVTDVGSTKQEIVARLENIFPNFVGSHPLAGSEKRSIANADPEIFEGTICILTPTRKTKSRALNRIKEFWRRVGVTTINLTPESHDMVLSVTSHLPHIAAFSLIQSVPVKYFRFASGGLKDTTRIAASDTELWLDVFLSNRNNTLKAIAQLQKNLARVKSALKNKDRKSLAKILKGAKVKREKLQ